MPAQEGDHTPEASGQDTQGGQGQALVGRDGQTGCLVR